MKSTTKPTMNPISTANSLKNSTKTSASTFTGYAPIVAHIEQLAWMAGSWSGHVNADPVDEHWSHAAGGVMMGMFRWLKNGQLYLYELLTIEPEGEGLVLRLKHFNRGLNGWEDKVAAIAFPLVLLGQQEATFARGGTFRSTQFIYQRRGNDELTVLTEDRRGDEVTHNEFCYRQHQFGARAK
jgi:hypothetical protein